MDPVRRRALSDFYREEFLRHLQYLELSGCLSEANTGGVAQAWRRFMGDLDRQCSCSDFPALAEGLLERFDALTGLSQLDPRRGH